MGRHEDPSRCAVRVEEEGLLPNDPAAVFIGGPRGIQILRQTETFLPRRPVPVRHGEVQRSHLSRIRFSEQGAEQEQGLLPVQVRVEALALYAEPIVLCRRSGEDVLPLVGQLLGDHTFLTPLQLD